MTKLAGGIKKLSDEDEILDVINSAARRYEGTIPEDRWDEPYMSLCELREEMREMDFYGLRSGRLLAVVGVQDLFEVTLIRHLYVRPGYQGRGIGTALLKFAVERAQNDRIMVGTWKDAWWAIDFYEKNGFKLAEDREALLRRYWDIPDRQVEESVVLKYGK